MGFRTFTVALEGPVDIPIINKILLVCGLQMGPVHGLHGKSLLDRRIQGYNNAARFSDWLVLHDLDRDAPCAPALAQRLMPSREPRMRFRIAIRATEAWLIADREAIARFLEIDSTRVPTNPESLHDPKAALIDLARASPNKRIRRDIVPAPGTSPRVGPAYLSRMTEFALGSWRPRIAARHSGSLRRCIEVITSEGGP
jgi:hypothetical protein